MTLLIHHIKKLLNVSENPPEYRAGKEMSYLPSLEDAWIYCDGEKIRDYGTMNDLPEAYRNADESYNAESRLLMPSYCDPHTHLVYPGSRELEFIDKIKGLSYVEIARRGGGILNSAALLAKTSENELFTMSSERIREIMRMGTGAVEIKSGYGLSLEGELKMLRVIRRLKDAFPLTIKSTFLGAHAIPADYKNDKEGYIKLIINEMIPAVAEEKIADFIDVFCDVGFFTPAETSRILEQGIKYGLRPKIHANELAHSGGVKAGVDNNALSVDHLEFTAEEEIKTLLASRTMPTLLPGTSFFLGIGYAPARKMIDSGLPIALASDYNPGSSPSGNMNFIFSLSAIKLRMFPEESLNAITLNAAYAMNIEKEMGSITKGKQASFIITNKIQGIESIPYSFGSSCIKDVYCKGKRVI
ncbi:MAG: imidazolonepropionase [Bacteroidales bacterium]|nr:imidazolonepropionase [Bacteroidales bacterium]